MEIDHNYNNHLAYIINNIHYFEEVNNYINILSKVKEGRMVANFNSKAKVEMEKIQ